MKKDNTDINETFIELLGITDEDTVTAEDFEASEELNNIPELIEKYKHKEVN